MSYVGGSYSRDVFVSYAHGQDLEIAYSDPSRNPFAQMVLRLCGRSSPTLSGQSFRHRRDARRLDGPLAEIDRVP